MTPFCAALLTMVMLGQPSTDARALYGRAIELEAQGNHAAARSLLWEAGGLAPADADIQNRLGETLERIGALEAAIDAFRQALAARPGFTRAANNLIRTLAKAGKGGEAVERARAQVATAPQDADAHFTLGLAQAEQDVEASMASFRRALQLAPRHALARYNLALVLNRTDRTAEAIEELTRAIESEPRAEAFYTLGVIAWQQGDFDRATAMLHRAIEAERRYADAWLALGSVLKARRDFKAAADALRRAIELRPDLWHAHYTLSQVLRLSGDEAGAQARLEEAERLRRAAQTEREASAVTAVGIERLEKGDAAAAADQFRRATVLLPAYAPAHYQLGRALHQLGQRDAAQAAFARAFALNPSLVPPPDYR